MIDLSAFPQRLRNARTAKGWSMEELCSRMPVPVSKMAISRYERGECKPSSEHLYALASALEVAFDDLVRPFAVTMGKIQFRKKQSVSRKTGQMLEQAVADIVERYAETEELCGVAQKCELPSFQAGNAAEAREAARNLRKEWMLGDGSVGDTIGLLEEHGVKVVEMDDVAGFDGLSSTADGQCKVIALAKDSMPERKRLSAMHELGHLVLDFPQETPDKMQERLCNSFAGEMLLPESLLKAALGGRDDNDIGYNDVRPFQLQFGVSADAVMYKLMEIGVISKKRLAGFEVHKHRKPDYKKLVERSFWHDEHPNRFERLVWRALDRRLITLSKAAVLVGKDIEYVKREFVPE